MCCVTRYSVLLPATIAVVVCAASAQDAPPIWQPVDQSVSDLDLRATSSRYVEQGIGVFGQDGALYQRAGDGYMQVGPGQTLHQQYQLRQPGYTAWIDQPDYLVNDPLGEMRLNVAPGRDRHFVDLIPPNTVFDLVPASERGFLQVQEVDPIGYDPNQLNTRIDGYIGGPVQGGMYIEPLPAPPKAHKLPKHLLEQRQSRARDERVVEEGEVVEDAQAVEPTEGDTTAEP